MTKPPSSEISRDEPKTARPNADTLQVVDLQAVDLQVVDLQGMSQTCLGHAARRTANLLTRHYNAHLAPLGLELTQAQLLAVIGQGGASSSSEIARWLGIDRSTLARNLKPLEAAGFITVQSAKGRKVLPMLTPRGEEQVAALFTMWRNAQAALDRELGPEVSAALRRNLSALRKAVRTLEQASPPVLSVDGKGKGAKS